MGGQGGLAGPEGGTYSQAQRRPRPSGSRNPGPRAQGPCSAAGALLQRLRAQHFLTIWLNTWSPDDHSCFMLVLGHLGAQRLLSNFFTLDSAQRGGRRRRGGWRGAVHVARTNPQDHGTAGPIRCCPTPPPDPLTGHTLHSARSLVAHGHLQATAKRGPAPPAPLRALP